MVDTHVEAARERVRAEREATAAKRAAYRAFRERVAELPLSNPGPAAGVTATAGSERRSRRSGCRAVRTAFAETVGDHTDADATLAGIREGLGDAVAVPLAPTTAPGFTEGVRDVVLAASERRIAETGVLADALAAEEEELERASEVVAEVTDWIATAEETPLTELGFGALAARHRTLADHRERCAAEAAARQAFLDGTTNAGTDVGVRHRSVVRSLYEDFPHDYPALATLARLESVCEECQRSVRDHLTRRA